MKDKREGAEKRNPVEREEGVGMQAGAGGRSDDTCTITHEINLKVLLKIPFQAYCLIKRV